MPKEVKETLEEHPEFGQHLKFILQDVSADWLANPDDHHNPDYYTPEYHYTPCVGPGTYIMCDPLLHQYHR